MGSILLLHLLKLYLLLRTGLDRCPRPPWICISWTTRSRELLPDISWPLQWQRLHRGGHPAVRPRPQQEALLYTLSFVYIFIFVIGMIANLVVVWVNICTRPRATEAPTATS